MESLNTTPRRSYKTPEVGGDFVMLLWAKEKWPLEQEGSMPMRVRCEIQQIVDKASCRVRSFHCEHRERENPPTHQKNFPYFFHPERAFSRSFFWLYLSGCVAEFRIVYNRDICEDWVNGRCPPAVWQNGYEKLFIMEYYGLCYAFNCLWWCLWDVLTDGSGRFGAETCDMDDVDGKKKP